MKAGVGFLVAAMALTPVTDGLSKSLALEHSAFAVTFARYFMAGVVALLLSIILKKPLHIPRHDRLGQVWRTALMMGAMILLISALSMVPLAKAVGGFLIAPVVASLISVLLFGERMDGYRFFGSALSFAGAFVILRPEGSFEAGTFMALAGGTLLGCYLAATRRACTCGSLFSTLVTQSFLGAAMVAPLAFWNGIPQITLSDGLFVLALGMVSATCHFLTVAAYNRADASILSPFFYFNIVFAIPVGYFWFGEVPTVLTLLGLSGIATGGVVAMLSASRRESIFSGVLALPRNYARKYLLKV